MKKLFFSALACGIFSSAWALDPYDNFPDKDSSYFINYVGVYTSTAYNDKSRESVNDPDLTLMQNTLRYAKYYELGGMPVISTVLVPIAKIQAFDQSDQGLGDITIGNGVWFYSDPAAGLHSSFSLFVTAPTGSYSAERAVNVGSNVWKVTPSINAAYAYDNIKLESSLRYSVYSENKDTDQTQGDELSLEIYAGYGKGPVQYGLHYNYLIGEKLKQSDGFLADSEPRSSQIGVSALWHMSATEGLSLEYFDDIAQENTLDGQLFLLRYTQKL